MAEQWSVEDWHEYQRTGRTPNRNPPADSSADVERATVNAPFSTQGRARLHYPVRITVVSYRNRLADADGISAKYAIDALIKCGILPDDGPKYVAEVAYRQEKSKEEKTVLIIEEV